MAWSTLGLIVPLAFTGAALVSPTSASAGTTIKAADFLGTWHVHDGQLYIVSKTFGIRTDEEGVGQDVAFLTLAVTHHGTRMEVTTQGVGFISEPSGTSGPLPDPTESFRQGDSYTLEFVAPHLLKEIDIHTHYQVIGNPYWCGSGLAEKYEHLCGA